VKYKHILLKLLKHPVVFKEICHYLKNDLSGLLGRYQYEHRILYIAGLAKSGSTWLSNMLAKIPGYNVRSINDPNGVIFEQDVCDPIFSTLPKYGYSIIKLHTRYSKKNLEIIKRYVTRFIVTYRDLRDMCVSRYSHVIIDPKHRHHKLYCSLGSEEAISHCIGVVKEAYVPWVRDWIDVASANKDTTLAIKYENLNLSTFATLKRIGVFYGFKLSDDFIAKLAATKIKKERNLKRSIKKNLPGRLRDSGRKGIVGDWKNFFTDRHKQEFKKIAGSLLIELGYEKNYNW